MKIKTFYLLLPIILSGCTAPYLAKNCIDAKFDRPPKPINGMHLISLKTNNEMYNLTVECEKYYNAHCSVRGNYWDIRIKGLKHDDHIAKIKYRIDKNYTAEIRLPSCKNLIKYKNLYPGMFRVLVDGMLYSLESSTKNIYTYKRLYKDRKPDRKIPLPQEISLYLDINYEYKKSSI